MDFQKGDEDKPGFKGVKAPAQRTNVQAQLKRKVASKRVSILGDYCTRMR
jgi:hypothetical protein